MCSWTQPALFREKVSHFTLVTCLPSFFQGYEGSLIKLTSKQVCGGTRCCFHTDELMNEGVSQALVAHQRLEFLPSF